MTAPDPVAERAVALAGTANRAPQSLDQAVKDLLAAGDRGALEATQLELVGRVSMHSDDYEATAGLNLVNKALAATGWPDPYNWKRRRKP